MDRQVSTEAKLEFTGSGSEFFRIWIVNILLSIVTLGIYSAWAKVRTNKYLYSCTKLEGSSFEYHGNPMAILKGRLVVVAAVIGYNVAFAIDPVLGFAMFGALFAVMPWLIWRSLQFKLYNTSYRGVRFGFDGSAKSAYWHYLVFPILGMLSLYTLIPKVHQSAKRFQHTQSRYGTRHFDFSATGWDFYKAYLIVFVPAIALIAALGFSMVSSMTAVGHDGDGRAPTAMIAFVVAIYAFMLVVGPLFFTMIQNLIWNSTSLGQHQFKSEMNWGRVLWIFFSNLVLIAITLGLFTPFAKVRMLKYRLESTGMLVAGSLDEFVADTSAGVSSLGEGAADILDFDLSM